MDRIHILNGWHLLLDYFKTSILHGSVSHRFMDNCRATERLPQANILTYRSQRFHFVPRGRNGRQDLLLIRLSRDFTVCYPHTSLISRNSIKIQGTVGASAIVINIISVGTRPCTLPGSVSRVSPNYYYVGGAYFPRFSDNVCMERLSDRSGKRSLVRL